MTRLVLFLLGVLAVAAGLAWLADRPGSLLINWEGYEVETSVFRAVVIFAALLAALGFVLSILRQVWTSPATVGHFLNRRRQRRGLDALSSGMIAIGAGDRGNATRYAMQARKSLPNEPLTHLLRAQAAQLSGDKATARRIFEAMLASPDTEQLGLRGLYLEAMRVKETEAARQFAERAVGLNPKLTWPVEALFDLQCKAGDWASALATLTTAKKHGHMDKASADRRRAVLLTAQAQALEDSDADKALGLALEAHGLAPMLIPAAAIAGRVLAARGNTARAAKVLQRTWAKAPHPDLATAYAYARIGDSPRDRLDRVKQLAALNLHSIESPIAVAMAAIESKHFDEARHALAPLLEGRLTQRVATLMARIEGEEHGDKGKVREWLARAVNAPHDPVWTADGAVAERWAAISPVTGKLDAFQWRVPVDDLHAAEGEELTTRLESLVALGAPGEIEAVEAIPEPVVAPVAAKKPARRVPDPIDTSARDRTEDIETTAAPIDPVRVSTGRESTLRRPSRSRDDAVTLEVSATDGGSNAASEVEREAASAPATGRPLPRASAKSEPRGKRKDDTVRVAAASPAFPRAPDDPGLEPEEDALAGVSLRPSRAT